MAGHHTTGIATIKAVFQNKITGLYLSNKGYWEKTKSIVTRPGLVGIRKEAEVLHAYYTIIKD